MAKIGRQFSEGSDEAPLHSYPNYGSDSNAGESVSDGLQFADIDLTGNARFKQNNIISSDDADYAGQSTASRITVDVSKADRGKEY